MIRREERLPDGALQWVLLAQKDHAHLSGELAAQWGAGEFAPLEPQQEVVWATYHHDDGWPTWDQAPKLDPQDGRPLAFTEVPLEDALAIWRSSIQHASEYGALPAWLVAAHFSALLRHSQDADHPEALGWLSKYDQLMGNWLRAWQEEDPDSCPEPLAQRGFEQLQMFDRISLWFCCAERTESLTLPTPAGPELTITPQGEGRFTLSPWPLHVDALTLEITGLALPADDYRDRWPAPLESAVPRTYRWQLAPQ